MKQDRDEGMGLPRGSARRSVWRAWVLMAPGLILTVLGSLCAKSDNIVEFVDGVAINKQKRPRPEFFSHRLTEPLCKGKRIQFSN